jgi:hypothetical protein
MQIYARKLQKLNYIMQIRLGQPTCIHNTYPVQAEFSYNCYVYELTKFIKKSEKIIDVFYPTTSIYKILRSNSL